MGHSKLPWRAILDTSEQHGHIVNESYTIAKTDCRYGVISEPEANAILIVTAVNVMPEVKRILRCIIDKKINSALRRRTFEGRCESLLEKLEAADE